MHSQNSAITASSTKSPVSTHIIPKLPVYKVGHMIVSTQGGLLLAEQRLMVEMLVLVLFPCLIPRCFCCMVIVGKEWYITWLRQSFCQVRRRSERSASGCRYFLSLVFRRMHYKDSMQHLQQLAVRSTFATNTWWRSECWFDVPVKF